jgi:hypothetical protein
VLNELSRTPDIMCAAPFISKSKLLWGHHCPKLLLTAYKAKNRIPCPGVPTRPSSSRATRSAHGLPPIRSFSALFPSNPLRRLRFGCLDNI